MRVGDGASSDLSLSPSRKRKTDGRFDSFDPVPAKMNASSPLLRHSALPFPSRPLYLPNSAASVSSLRSYFPVNVDNPCSSSSDDSEISHSPEKPPPRTPDFENPDMFLLIKPPFTIAGLSVVAFLALGGESVTSWQIGEKLRELFPYWGNGNRIFSLLLSITSALTNMGEVFVQDTTKVKYLRNIYKIKKYEICFNH